MAPAFIKMKRLVSKQHQTLLVKALLHMLDNALNHSDKTAEELAKELNRLYIAYREDDSSPGETGAENFLRITRWVRVQSFAARLSGKGFKEWDIAGIRTLRHVLEEPLPKSAPERDTWLKAACEWMKHAGDNFYLEGQNSMEPTEIQAVELRVGSLASHLQPTMNLGRWYFWCKRLEEVPEEVGEELDGETRQNIGVIMEDMTRWHMVEEYEEQRQIDMYLDFLNHQSH
ncbi:hypothetical protein FSARC_6192 [Fusarium sarcochroum]|uniref:Uncharacterized protein n=1 Tax=Fusarium sarcochroum TaxID=1208366 RepID=A0A8H4TXP8_9HYPO|nr:hypothetical protein FSARC_6192 [Fusarium sarcochroum]